MPPPLCRVLHLTSINWQGKERGEGDFEEREEELEGETDAEKGTCHGRQSERRWLLVAPLGPL